jgi:hypothetical protein
MHQVEKIEVSLPKEKQRLEQARRKKFFVRDGYTRGKKIIYDENSKCSLTH